MRWWSAGARAASGSRPLHSERAAELGADLLRERFDQRAVLSHEQHAHDRLGAGVAHEQPAVAGEPRDFGAVVAFLCSEPAGFISGVALGVDGAAVTGLL